MIAKVIFSNGAEVDHVRLGFKLVLGDKAAIDLRGVYGTLKWGAEDNDEVLGIQDYGGPTAIISADAIGKSTLIIRNERNAAQEGSLRLLVEVIAAPQTTSVGFSFGNVRDIAK